MIIAPDGGDAWAPAKPRPDETLIRALARAHRWKRMLEEGRYRSAAEIAEAEGITRSFVSRLLRLTLLAPDIVRPSSTGGSRKAMQLEELTGAHSQRMGEAAEGSFVGRAPKRWSWGASRQGGVGGICRVRPIPNLRWPLAFNRDRERAVTCGCVGIVLAAELRAQQPRFRAYAREERRDKQRREQHADPERKARAHPGELTSNPR